MPAFIALDAGGTNTRCWVADESRLLGRATGGTVKIMNVGEEAATHTLRTLVRDALTQAGLKASQVTRTCMGLAGISSDQVRHWAQETLQNEVGGEVVLCGDEEIALEAGFRGGPGILVIAGTGSHVIGRCTNGTIVNVGGWGPMVGDEGSGTWIGLEAIRAALRSKDRGMESMLLKEIQAHWKLKSLGELISKSNNYQRRPNFSELVPVVVACAEKGDALATSVLRRAGDELAVQVGLAVAKMNAIGCHPGDADMVDFTGSVLGKIELVRSSMESRLEESHPDVKVATAAVEPLDGALWRARQGN